MNENICRFVPFHGESYSIQTVNFVLETKAQIYSGLKSEAVYKMYYVRSGDGYLHTPGRITPLTRGTVFFTFAGYPFAIESGEAFTYMYIGFIGQRGNMIMESLKIGCEVFCFPDFEEVADIWERGIKLRHEVNDLISESVLLYTFSYLGNRILRKNEVQNSHSAAAVIKKYVDEHFAETDFSLEALSCELSYNKKYVSTVFKKQFGFGITEYINTVRIQNACTMLEQGFTSINDISEKCGYTDSRYFSKLFKSKIGLTPTDYIKSLTSR